MYSNGGNLKYGKSKARIKKKLTERNARQICMSLTEALVYFPCKKKYYRPHDKLSASHSYVKVAEDLKNLCFFL